MENSVQPAEPKFIKIYFNKDIMPETGWAIQYSKTVAKIDNFPMLGPLRYRDLVRLTDLDEVFPSVQKVLSRQYPEESVVILDVGGELGNKLRERWIKVLETIDCGYMSLGKQADETEKFAIVHDGLLDFDALGAAFGALPCEVDDEEFDDDDEDDGDADEEEPTEEELRQAAETLKKYGSGKESPAAVVRDAAIMMKRLGQPRKTDIDAPRVDDPSPEQREPSPESTQQEH